MARFALAASTGQEKLTTTRLAAAATAVMTGGTLSRNTVSDAVRLLVEPAGLLILTW